MKFEKVDEEEFRDSFISIIGKGATKNNTYKFALARFLLDHSNNPKTDTDTVRFSEIGRYFLKYYWLQECKSKLRQGPKTQPPVIITIIRKYFKKDKYPETFDEIEKEEPEKIKKCIDEITKECFDDVIPRFQKIGRKEKRIFYHYLAKEYHDSADNKKLDPKGGILLNKKAIRFFKENHAPLYTAVILEWIRFLETKNLGMPNLVRKVEGKVMGQRDQTKFRKQLELFFDSCFYCDEKLKNGKNAVHVDHVIPYDYIGNTELWNMVLACQKCNCEKSGSLPPLNYIENLILRNKDSTDKEMQNSLDDLNYSNQDVCSHYLNAKRHGYPIWANPPKKMNAISRVCTKP